jgi:SAM-dependent methyltransferase
MLDHLGVAERLSRSKHIPAPKESSMHPKVNDLYQELAEKYEMKGPFLEIGVGAKQDAILSGSYFQGKPGRFATNLSDKEIADEEGETKIEFIRCNSQNMRNIFADGQFGTVLSNAVLEHDKYFWRSLEEMKRVLAPGGLLAIGAPGYIPRSALQEGIINDKIKSATATMDVHSAPDYWRFSRSAFKEVICEGLEVLETRTFARVPVLIAVARMPLQGMLPPVPQGERAGIMAAEKAAKLQKRAARAEKRGTAPKDPTGAAPETGTEESPKRRKANPVKEARLQKRDARLQAREARLLKRRTKPEKPSEKSKKASAKEAKLQVREDRLKARAAKSAAANGSKAAAAGTVKPGEAKRKRQRSGDSEV